MDDLSDSDAACSKSSDILRRQEATASARSLLNLPPPATVEPPELALEMWLSSRLYIVSRLVHSSAT